MFNNNKSISNKKHYKLDSSKRLDLSFKVENNIKNDTQIKVQRKNKETLLSSNNFAKIKLLNDMFSNNPFNRTENKKSSSIRTYNSISNIPTPKQISSNESKLQTNSSYKTLIKSTKNKVSESATTFGKRKVSTTNLKSLLNDSSYLIVDKKDTFNSGAYDNKITAKKYNYCSAPTSPRKTEYSVSKFENPNKNPSNYKISVMKEIIYNNIPKTSMNSPRNKQYNDNFSDYAHSSLRNINKQELINKKFNSSKVRQQLVYKGNEVDTSFVDNKITVSKVPSKSFLVKQKVNYNVDHVKFGDFNKKDKKY